MVPQSYDLAGQHFRSKVLLRAEVRRILEGYKFYEQIQNPVILELFAKHHHRIPQLGLKPTICRKAPAKEGRGYEMEVYLTGSAFTGWHDASWVKCIFPPSYMDEVRQSLRSRIKPEMDSLREDWCDHCGNTEDLEVDHVVPTFKEMIQEVSKHFPPGEVETWAHHDWLHNERFSLPEGHPVLVAFDELQETATVHTLCRSCHAEKTSRGYAP